MYNCRSNPLNGTDGTNSNTLTYTSCIMAYGAVGVTVPSYSYAGCYGDSPSRALPSKLWQDSNFMTVDRCAAKALSQGFAYFGLQAGQGRFAFIGRDELFNRCVFFYCICCVRLFLHAECWAGISFSSAKMYGLSSGCTLTCSGNKSINSVCGELWFYIRFHRMNHFYHLHL